MKNQMTGLYEVSKYINSIGKNVTGTGSTQDAAKEDLKTKIKAYKSQPLVPSGETVRSPGYVMKSENGVVSYEYDDNRQVAIMVRQELKGDGHGSN